MRVGVLFEVAIQHDYWWNLDAVVHDALQPAQQTLLRRRHGVEQFLKIAPTRETQRVLAGHRMIFKPQQTGFLVGVELTGGGSTPRHPIAPGTLLRFALRLADPLMPDYTAGISRRFHRFGNDSGNEQAAQLFLTQPVPPHQPTRAYIAGEIRVQSSGSAINLFQALRDTGPSATPVAADWQRIPADTHDAAASYRQGAIVLAGNVLFEALVNSPSADLTDATQWSAVGTLANQYVTAADRIPLRPRIFDVDVQALGASALTLSITPEGADAPGWQRRYESTEPLRSLQADLRGLADGRYRLDVLDAALAPQPELGLDFYLSDEGVAEGWFGIIEIGAGAGSFALFDGGGQLRSPRYRIRFLNQAARRRYRFPLPQPTGAGAQVAADPADERILVTPEPLPVTRAGGGTRLRADDPDTTVSEQVLLPHIGARGLSKEAGQWFSDMHVSNLPPLT